MTNTEWGRLATRSILVPGILGCLGLVACASDPPPAPENLEARARLADAVATDAPITDEAALRAAIDAGYELTYQNGERVYCKRQPAFGTRVRERIVCLTEDEARTLRNDARDYMDNVSRSTLPKDE